MKIKIILYLFGLLCSIKLNSQILNFDQNWTQNTLYSDEFNSAYFDLHNQWYVLNGIFYSSPGVEDPYTEWSNSTQNLYIETYNSEKYAVLKLMSPSLGSYGKPYSGVQFESVHKYTFGYFEARLKQAKGAGYHGGFWMWGAKDSECWYNEIDVAEPYGTNSEQCTTMGTNLHTFNGNVVSPYPCANAGQNNQHSPLDITNLPDLSQWHTYGCEWLPDRVVWYFDNNIVRVEKNPNVIPLHNMSVTFDLMADFPITDFTNNFIKVDYFRYYELKTDDCNISVSQSNFDFTNSANYTLKKSYSLSNSVMPAGLKRTLRATDFIQLNNNFEIPFGTEITFQINPCF